VKEGADRKEAGIPETPEEGAERNSLKEEASSEAAGSVENGAVPLK